jgi:beta-glucosidase
MPWLQEVKGILAAWYPGIGGAQAIANILFGDVNPSGKLPVTFPKTEADLPHPQVVGIDLEKKARAELAAAHRGGDPVLPPFDVPYTEGAKAGYKWFETEKKEPLFPFGFGLSYSSYEYSGLKIDETSRQVTFIVKNKGPLAGSEVAQVYVQLPSAANEPYKRLVAFERITMNSGESKSITLPLTPKYLSVFNDQSNSWQLLPGEYRILVGTSSAAATLTSTLRVH